MSNVYFLQGQGQRSDAVFEVMNNDRVYVVAEVGMTGCYDEVMPVEAARKVYKMLRECNWQRVNASRRTAKEIARDIRD
jgi:calcineurin-like phosphoesterase